MPPGSPGSAHGSVAAKVQLSRRESISAAAGNLQQLGCIRYRRGHIAVLDRIELETRACECYAVVKKEMGRLLADVRHRQDIATVVPYTPLD